MFVFRAHTHITSSGSRIEILCRSKLCSIVEHEQKLKTAPSYLYFLHNSHPASDFGFSILTWSASLAILEQVLFCLYTRNVYLNMPCAAKSRKEGGSDRTGKFFPTGFSFFSSVHPRLSDPLSRRAWSCAAGCSKEAHRWNRWWCWRSRHWRCGARTRCWWC